MARSTPDEDYRANVYTKQLPQPAGSHYPPTYYRSTPELRQSVRERYYGRNPERRIQPDDRELGNETGITDPRLHLPAKRSEFRSDAQGRRATAKALGARKVSR